MTFQARKLTFLKFHNFPARGNYVIKFHNFTDLETFIIKVQDFPALEIKSMTFQVFQDPHKPCHSADRDKRLVTVFAAHSLWLV